MDNSQNRTQNKGETNRLAKLWLKIKKQWENTKWWFWLGTVLVNLLVLSHRRKNNTLLNNIKRLPKKSGNDSPVDILFITPPYWDVYGPFSAVPCLVSELNKYGVTSKNIDLGIVVFHEEFNRRWHKISKTVQSKAYYELNVKDYIHKDFDSYPEFLTVLDFLNDKNQKLSDFQKIYPQLNFIQRAVFDSIVQEIINPPFALICQLILLSYKMRLNRLINTCDFSLIMDAMENFNLTEDFLNLPEIAGISITTFTQFLPALAVIKVLKAFKPEIKIIAGGSFMDYLMKRNPDAMKQFLENFADFVVDGEGETAIKMLIEHIKDNKHTLSSIPNLVYMEQGLLHSTEHIIEDVTSLDLPDYKGLDLSLYLAPKPILAYQTSRGCHWGHCAFCSREESYRCHYRKKEIGKVISDLKMMVEKSNVHHFQFVDEAIEPRYFIEFVDALSKEEFSKNIKWVYYSRISPLYSDEIIQKAKKCGCEMVLFGVETFCQRLLTFVKKGTTTKDIVANLEMFHRNGIKIHAWIMTRFPTQTKEEILYDVEMLEQNFKNIDSCYMGQFFLDVNCEMYSNPQKFGITKVDKYNGFNFQSTSNGKTINKRELNEAVDQYYYPLIKKHVISSTEYKNSMRYIVFFNE
jgi:hypothetical protein